jgi:hypothetical protein
MIERFESRVLLAAQAYDWNNVNIGAGGFVDGIFFDPQHQNTVYARTDIGGLFKTTNGGTSWNELLDFANNTTSNAFQQLGVLSFAMDPSNTNNLYLDTGMYSGSNGWLLRSTDGGHTFAQTNLPFYVGGNSDGRGTGERLAVDPNLGSILFLGTNVNGLYTSTNSGVSFSQVSFPVANAPITFVYFDPRSGSTGSATQTLYVGVNSTAAGTNIYRSIDGGTTWSELPSGPTGFIPMRAALASDGNLYFTFGNQLPPAGASMTNGAVWRYNTATSVWTNVSPVTPGAVSGDNFGYDGIAIDPNNPNVAIVTSFDRYSGPDTMWKTMNASAATPTWFQFFDPSSAQNFGFNGFNTTRNTSAAPWVAAYGDGIGNWAASVTIDPFNSAHLMYGTGQGLWATDHADSATKLTGANSWYFPDTGIEFTSVLKIVAPPTGTPLFSAMGDINGFGHTSLTTSPAAGGITATITGGGLGTMTSIDFAQSNPNILAIVGPTGSKHGAYTTSDGGTWTEFAAQPSGASGGSIAVGASGATFVWAPSSGTKAFYSTNNGGTWTAATFPTGTANGGTIVADRVDANRFYYWTENTNDNQWIIYLSTDGGHTFAKEATLGVGNVTLVPSPTTAGDLWISTYIGILHSTNSGANFSQLASVGSSNNITSMAFGKSAPGQTVPAMYLYGTSGNFQGAFRSDDGGTTWTQINDAAHQFGGLIQTMAGDPNVYGRVYMGVNGRGIVYGDIHSGPASLPAGWSSADIGSPGSAGAAGAANGTFEVIGGGSGVGAGSISDQFQFAYTTLTGDGTITALVDDVPNGSPGNYNAKAGVMIRDGLNASAATALVSLTPGSINGAIFQTRSTAGASASTIASATTGVYPPYWLRLQRSGNQFTAFVSPDGTTWTQLGSSQTIAMSQTIDIGLAVTSSNNSQLNISHFQNVTIISPPHVVSASYLADTALNKLSFAFDQDVTGLQPTDLVISPGGATATNVTFDTSTHTATFTIRTLPDGNYTASLSNAAAMIAEYDLPFFVLRADANRDRVVNALDFNIVASNFGATNQTLSTGDLNYDGSVDTADFTLLAQQFGASVPTPALPLLASTKPDLFATHSTIDANHVGGV